MKTKYIVLVHVLFWLYILNQGLFPFYINKEVDFYYYLDLPVTTALNVMNFYLFYFCIVPVLLRGKRIALSILYGLAGILVFAVFRDVVQYFYYNKLFGYTSHRLFGESIIYYNDIRITFITSLYALLIKFAIDWFYNQKVKSELINQNQASELALLRSQINPHFLFNTLNNIYSLVYKKSDEAPEAVMKLSGIMRYMLYDANADKVPLDKEVEYMMSFVELQKLRLKQKDYVAVEISGSVDGRMIAPMLLIPFVENAFKHGSRKGPAPGIVISLAVRPQEIELNVSNYLPQGHPAVKDKEGGIGLQNIRRRLDLLYSGSHSLEIQEDEKTFKVRLRISTPTLASQEAAARPVSRTSIP